MNNLKSYWGRESFSENLLLGQTHQTLVNDAPEKQFTKYDEIC